MVGTPRKYLPTSHGITCNTAFGEAGYYVSSKANERPGHWSVSHRKAKEQRNFGGIMALQTIMTGRNAFSWPHATKESTWSVKLVRVAPRPLDSDNLQAAFKNIRDGVAEALGLDDKWNGKIQWHYDQVVSREYGVRLELERLSETSTAC